MGTVFAFITTNSEPGLEVYALYRPDRRFIVPATSWLPLADTFYRNKMEWVYRRCLYNTSYFPVALVPKQVHLPA